MTIICVLIKFADRVTFVYTGAECLVQDFGDNILATECAGQLDYIFYEIYLFVATSDYKQNQCIKVHV